MTSTLDDARRIIDSLKAAGVAFLKIHGVGASNNPTLYFAILREARRVGLPVVGYTPDQVREVEVENLAPCGGGPDFDYISRKSFPMPTSSIRP
jgi:hypothetical protein